MIMRHSALLRYLRAALVLSSALWLAGCCTSTLQKSKSRSAVAPPSPTPRSAAEEELVEALWSYHEAAIKEVLDGVETGRYHYNSSGGRDFDIALDFFEMTTGIMSDTAVHFGRMITPSLPETFKLWQQWHRDNRSRMRFDSQYCPLGIVPRSQ